MEFSITNLLMTYKYMSFSTPGYPADIAREVKQVRDFISEICSWMVVNKVKLNPSKREFIILQLKHNFRKHVEFLIKARVTLQSVVTALVWSNLDYCNAMLSKATAFQLSRLQRLQNRAARLITGVGIRDHITPVLKELHWLPVELRIHFNVLLYILKALRGQAPQYLGELWCYKQHRSHLRQCRDLQVPLTQRSAREAVLSVQEPVLWNKLPHNIKAATLWIFLKINYIQFFFNLLYLANGNIYSWLCLLLFWT